MWRRLALTLGPILALLGLLAYGFRTDPREIPSPLRDGRYIRERPEFFVRQMRVYVDRQLISDFRLTSAVSSNPIIRFPVKVSRSGTLRVVFANSEGGQWEVSEVLRPVG